MARFALDVQEMVTGLVLIMCDIIEKWNYSENACVKVLFAWKDTQYDFSVYHIVHNFFLRDDSARDYFLCVNGLILNEYKLAFDAPAPDSKVGKPKTSFKVTGNTLCIWKNLKCSNRDLRRTYRNH